MKKKIISVQRKILADRENKESFPNSQKQLTWPDLSFIPFKAYGGHHVGASTNSILLYEDVSFNILEGYNQKED